METWKKVLLVLLALYAFWYIIDTAANVADTYNHVTVTSNVDGDDYQVLDTPSKQEAADALATTKQQMISVAKELQTSGNNIPDKFKSAVAKMQSFPHDTTLVELDPMRNDTVAFTLNKKHVHLCTRRNKRSSEDRATPETMLVVYAHEITHYSLPSYSAMDANGHTIHSPEFKELERLVLNAAVKLALISPTKAVGDEYCGISILSGDNAQ